MDQPVKRKPFIKWQKPNVRVVYALIAPAIASIYFFGWRSLLLLACVTLAGFITEYVFLRAYYKEPVTSAVFVTSFLFTLSLPPTLPIWIAVVGIVFGVLFGKMVFGGFGRNIFNPALTGRAFIYISFGAFMTASWVNPFQGFPGGFAFFAADAVTKATPMMKISAMNFSGFDITGVKTGISQLSLLLGNISGSLGETSAILILIGGIYIVIKKYANYRIVISSMIGMLLVQTSLWLFGVKGAIDPLSAFLGGGFVLGSLFMATDPVSASQTNTGRWIYGGFVGVVSSIIRIFSIWSGGVMFAILLGNMFAPIIDYYIKQAKKSKGGAK
jgi:Na+-transporting NADH:ubiquinone oxidoreductase subunit B